MDSQFYKNEPLYIACLYANCLNMAHYNNMSINLSMESLTLLKDDKASEFKGLTLEGAWGCNSRGNDTQLANNQLTSLSKFLFWSHVWEYFDLTQMQLKLLITHRWHCSIPVMIIHRQNPSLYTRFKFHFEVKVKLPETHFDLSHSRFWPILYANHKTRRTELKYPSPPHFKLMSLFRVTENHN